MDPTASPPLPSIVDPRLSLPGIHHGFFTRVGGVSTGMYTSLNCGIGSRDERAAIAENRARVASAIGTTAEQLATPYQVHGVNTVTVTKVWAPGMGPKADAIVTNQRGVALGISTADCGPILFADAGARVIGAAHAGWRGALAGIGEAAIAAMETLGARRKYIVAVLGPTISQANYEVGSEVRDQFVAGDPKSAHFFKPSQQPNHFLFDLPGAIVARLTAAGVAASAVNLCTYAEPDRFFSYRRTTHERETDYGRMLSTIMLAD